MLNEQQIVDCLALRARRLGHFPVMNNVNVFTWESDLLTVTKSGYVHEFEIKVSRADYRRDKKTKDIKYQVLDKGHFTWDRTFYRLGEYIKEGVEQKRSRPAYFWYATPPGLVDPVELEGTPFGLVEIHERLRRYWDGDGYSYLHVEVVKPARRLHSEKITDRQRVKCLEAGYWRYWRRRDYDRS